PARVRPLLPRHRGARAGGLRPRPGDRPPGRRAAQRHGPRRGRARRRSAAAPRAAGLSSDSYLARKPLSFPHGSIRSMRTHTIIRPLLAAVLTVAALAVSACGDEAGAGGDTAADRDKETLDAGIKFARCMREHGIDMPDPQPGQRGLRLMQKGDAPPQTLREADEACRKYLEDVAPPEMSEAQKKE